MMKTGKTKNQKETARYRSLSGAAWWIFFTYSAMMILWCIIYTFHLDQKIAGTAIMEGTFLAGLLSSFMPLVFFIFPASKTASRERVPWYDIMLAILAFSGPLWIAINAYDVAVLGLEVDPPLIAKISGIITWVLILEACRRTTGLMFATIVLAFSIYPIFSNYMPSFLLGKGYSLDRIVGYHYLGVESIFGLPMHVYGRTIISFLIFAVALEITGGAKFFLDLAQGFFGKVRGGPAKVSIFASAFFGSISGSVVANIATTGAVTIPTMKKVGYPAYYAGAVEACASAGGVLMPPIMGVTAFIMAEFLGIPYLEVVLAAIIPSMLYYLGLFIQVDGFAAKKGLTGVPDAEQIPPLSKTMKWGWPYLLSIALLLGVLGWLRLETWAAWFAVLFLFMATAFRKETRVTPQSFKQFVFNSGRVMAELTVIIAGGGDDHRVAVHYRGRFRLGPTDHIHGRRQPVPALGHGRSHRRDPGHRHDHQRMLHHPRRNSGSALGAVRAEHLGGSFFPYVLRDDFLHHPARGHRSFHRSRDGRRRSHAHRVTVHETGRG